MHFRHHEISARFLLFAYVLLVALNAFSLALSVTEDMHARNDFRAFYTGWTLAREGAELYDLDLQRGRQLEIMARDGYTAADFKAPFLPFTNPSGRQSSPLVKWAGYLTKTTA